MKNTAPMCFTISMPPAGDAEFIRSLPGCVRSVIAWHAAPFRDVSFPVYDLVVNNFPSILAAIAKQGGRTAYFFPAYDPQFAPFAARQDRPVDVVFVEAIHGITGEGRRYWRPSRSWLTNIISCTTWTGRGCVRSRIIARTISAAGSTSETSGNPDDHETTKVRPGLL